MARGELPLSSFMLGSAPLLISISQIDISPIIQNNKCDKKRQQILISEF